LLIRSDAVVNDFVEIIVLSAFIGIKMVFTALLNLCLVFIALFWDESLPLSPVQHSIDIASIAAVIGLIAINYLLCGELYLLLLLLAYSITNDSQNCNCV